MPSDDFLNVLHKVGETSALIVHIVDIFDFEGSFILGLKRFIGQNPVILVVNKMDLLPKDINYNRMINWVQRRTKELGLRVMDVVLVSAKTNIGLDRLIASLGKHGADRDIYIVGATNVGKSSLVNRLIRNYSDLAEEITISQYPGTTLDLISIPLEGGKNIIDTPGIVYKHRLTEIMPRSNLDALIPQKMLKPIVYQLDEEQTLFFGGFARFDFVHGEHQSFSCYLSNSIQVHRTKLERADELFASHWGELLSPPNKEDLPKVPRWTRHSLRISRGDQADIVISGLGWIRVNRDIGAEVDVYAPKGVKVIVRRALI